MPSQCSRFACELTCRARKKFICIVLYCLLINLVKHHRLHAVMGDTLILGCNTAESSGVDWTQKLSEDGHFSYIYVNGSIMGDTNILIRFSVVNTSEGEYSLRIYNVHPAYSGWYNCYETDGRRIIGYYVVMTSMFFITFNRK